MSIHHISSEKSANTTQLLYTTLQQCSPNSKSLLPSSSPQLLPQPLFQAQFLLHRFPSTRWGRWWGLRKFQFSFGRCKIEFYIDQDLGFSRARVTAKDTAPGIALADPALILCSAANCSAGCFRIAIATAPVLTCQVPSSPPSFLSLVLDNPAATVIPWGVLVGNCNVSLVQIPQSNVCYNINPAGIHVVRIDSTTTPWLPNPFIVYQSRQRGWGAVLIRRKSCSRRSTRELFGKVYRGTRLSSLFWLRVYLRLKFLTYIMIYRVGGWLFINRIPETLITQHP